jgi:hypothetical protein
VPQNPLGGNGMVRRLAHDIAFQFLFPNQLFRQAIVPSRGLLRYGNAEE